MFNKISVWQGLLLLLRCLELELVTMLCQITKFLDLSFSAKVRSFIFCSKARGFKDRPRIVGAFLFKPFYLRRSNLLEALSKQLAPIRNTKIDKRTSQQYRIEPVSFLQTKSRSNPGPQAITVPAPDCCSSLIRSLMPARIELFLRICTDLGA